MLLCVAILGCHCGCKPLTLGKSVPAGMPSNADRLWVFENFSRYGAVAGLRILIDEGTGLCNGTG